MGMEVGRVAAQPVAVKAQNEPAAGASQGGEVRLGNPPNTQELIAETFNLKAIDEQQLREIIEKLNRVFDVLGTELRFQVHQATKEIMIQVVDVASGQVLKEIPPEKILNMIGQMMKTVGLLVDEKA